MRSFIRFLNQKLIVREENTFFLFLFRMYFSLMGILFAFASIEFIRLRWDYVNYDYGLILPLYICWIILLVLMFLGIGGRIRNFLHYLLVLFILHPYGGTDLGISVQETVYLLPSFWLIFINTDVYAKLTFNKTSRPYLQFKRTEGEATYNHFAIWAFGVNWGLILVYAAACKFFDPLWHEGIGFYCVAYLPWIKLPFSDTLLNYKWLWLGLNYGAEILEVCFLFLFLFRKTRFLSAILLFVFFGGLIFPLRISYIGEIGLAFGFLVLAISPLPRFRGKTVRLLPIIIFRSKQDLILYKFVPLGLIAITFFFFVMRLSRDYDIREYDYKVINGLPVTKQDSAEVAYRNSFWYEKIYQGIRKHTKKNTKVDKIQHMAFWMQNWALFTRIHVVGIYEYKIIFIDNNGLQHEPYVVYKNDMTGGEYTIGLVPRYLHAAMYVISDVANKKSLNINAEISQREQRIIDNLITFQKAKLKEEPVKVLIKVKAIRVPLKFDGMSKLYNDSKWTVLLEKDYGSGVVKWNQPEAFKLQSRVQGLPNFWVTKHPGF